MNHPPGRIPLSISMNQASCFVFFAMLHLGELLTLMVTFVIVLIARTIDPITRFKWEPRRLIALWQMLGMVNHVTWRRVRKHSFERRIIS